MFKIPRINVIESDEGFSIEMIGMFKVKYSEGDKTLLIGSEPLVGPAGLVLYPNLIKNWDPPHSEQLIDENRRAKIVDNIRRACAFRGFNIQVQW
jgi:hypothetical protein